MVSSKKKVYIETTIPSLITARPSREFWENERHKYDLFISKYVLEECSKGDVDAAKKRMELLKDYGCLNC